MGGYNSKGRAWRYKIPKHHLFKMNNNVLEYLSPIIGPWIDIIESALPLSS